MFILDWLRDFARLPGEIRAQNKVSGGITKGNVIAFALGSVAAIGCGYGGYWGWSIGIAFASLVALVLNGDVAELIGRLMNFTVMSALGGIVIGGAAFLFGATFTPWCVGSSVILCIGMLLWFGLD